MREGELTGETVLKQDTWRGDRGGGKGASGRVGVRKQNSSMLLNFGWLYPEVDGVGSTLR